MRLEVSLQSSKCSQRNHNLDIDIYMSLEEFFATGAKMLGHECNSAQVERNGDIVMILNRKSYTLFMPYYLLHSHDTMVLRESLDVTYQEPIHRMEKITKTSRLYTKGSCSCEICTRNQNRQPTPSCKV